MRRCALMALTLALVFAVGLPALAHFNNWHTDNGYYHGHGSYGVPGTQTEGKTQKNDDSQNKVANVRNGSTGTVLCSHTTAGPTASCIANISVGSADSQHSGAGLAFHTMS
jgi:hypothetical protein